ncbi:glycoside hydrolase family 2 protein [Patellaria atrata CBS 101060]|uniref:Beta-mannosidase B n=1 Tax=Patellaria atrata CBS 101060 TaxID=1346257 RepID=A0A9P4S517_9PEZI|nr:glycoside hydrolase family 2 protein [Patellaria atrata CBS 101060]
MALRRTELKQFKWGEMNSHQWVDTTIPTNIHLDLLAAGRIPDPFVGMNEKDVQWVHDKDWIYSCEFPGTPQDGQYADLVFEGLDTYAVVKLNGIEILKSENMFIPYRVPIAHILKPMNHLEIQFMSAIRVGKEMEKKSGKMICWNGHSSRIYTRKAQYHYGWDWGPSLVTCGPWKPISLEQYNTRIARFDIHYELSKDFRTATIKFEVELAGDTKDRKVVVSIITPKGEEIGLITVHSNVLLLQITKISNPELWYPHTHGNQPLWPMTVTVTSTVDDTIQDTVTKRIGFRRIELIQTPIPKGSKFKFDEGNTFYFTCNEIPIFMGGSNWIPGDNFLPRMTPTRYESWIDLVVRGNQSMLRVWGGGIYEDDAFYEQCDKRGVLVWQDFLFACGQYSGASSLLDSVSNEAIANINRLKWHPSLAIMAGNNEDYQVASEALHHDMTSPEDTWLSSTFPARYIYEKLLPNLVKRYAPGLIYWPGSPWGGEDNNTDRTVGDIHVWNVSSGLLVPYQRYPDLVGRFVSEFGMLSCPHIETVKTFFGDSKDFHPQSQEMEFHCRATSQEKRVFTTISEQFRFSSFDLESFIYLTQLLQSEAMGWAFRGWRRAFEGRECGGALVWQTNDSWPVTSWAIIDHFQRPKPAYYTIARALTPLAIGIVRTRIDKPKWNDIHEALCNSKSDAGLKGVNNHSSPHVYPLRRSSFAVWIANATTKKRVCTIEVRYIDIATGKRVRYFKMEQVEAKPTGTTEVCVFECPEDSPTVLAARLVDEDGRLIAREMDWPQPLKHITFPHRGLQVIQTGEELMIRTEKPVKGLVFLNDGVQWSDNCLDVAPDDEQRVTAQGLTGDVKYRFYGQDDK